MRSQGFHTVVSIFLIVCCYSSVRGQACPLNVSSGSKSLNGVELPYVDANPDAVQIIQPKFDGIAGEQSFSEGIGNVTLHGKDVYIDEKGDVILSNLGQGGLNDFHEGLVAMTNDEGQTGVIDRTGKFVIEPRRWGIGYFSEGLAAAAYGPDWKWGFVDRRGDFMIRPIYDSVWPFSDGLAKVEVSKKQGFIDKTGKFVFPPQFDDAGSFFQGLTTVKVGDKWGVAAKNGQITIAPRYARLWPPSDGLVAALTEGKWGFIDLTGTPVIRPQFAATSGFFRGRAAVKVGTKWGFIDKSGQFVVQPQFDFANGFSAAGLAPVGYFDHSSATLKLGFIDRSGKIVVEPQFESIRILPKLWVGIRVKGKWGFLHWTGCATRFDSTSRCPLQISTRQPSFGTVTRLHHSGESRPR